MTSKNLIADHYMHPFLMSSVAGILVQFLLVLKLLCRYIDSAPQVCIELFRIL